MSKQEVMERHLRKEKKVKLILIEFYSFFCVENQAIKTIEGT